MYIAYVRLFLAGVILTLAVYFVDIPLAHLGKVGIWDSIFLLLVQLATFLVLSVQFQYLMRLIDKNFFWLDCLSLVSMNSLMNLALPFKSGLVLRGLLLKRHYGVKLREYGAMMLVGQVVLLSVALSVAVFFGFFSPAVVDVISVRLGGFFWLVFIWLCLVLISVVPLLVVSKLERVDVIWTFCKFTCFCMLFVVLKCFGFYLAYSLSGENGRFSELASVFSFSQSTLVFNLTPGNIGVREGVLVFLGAEIGIDSGQILKAAVLDRVYEMLVIFVLGGVSIYRLSKKFSDVDELRKDTRL